MQSGASTAHRVLGFGWYQMWRSFLIDSQHWSSRRRLTHRLQNDDQLTSSTCARHWRFSWKRVLSYLSQSIVISVSKIELNKVWPKAVKSNVQWCAIGCSLKCVKASCGKAVSWQGSEISGSSKELPSCPSFVQMSRKGIRPSFQLGLTDSRLPPNNHHRWFLSGLHVFE